MIFISLCDLAARTLIYWNRFFSHLTNQGYWYRHGTICVHSTLVKISVFYKIQIFLPIYTLLLV